MKIILSPAKKMVTDTDSIAPVGMPDFLDKTTEILSWMKGLEKDKLKAIWKCNDKIARQNFERLENMDLYHMLTPAILSYEGIAFQYMAPAVFEYGQFEYIQKHLRILSAFYGSLKPLDGVRPYRLEMQVNRAKYCRKRFSSSGQLPGRCLPFWRGCRPGALLRSFLRVSWTSLL